MSKKAFDKIAEGLNEALTVARGSIGDAKMYVPAEIDVKAIRGRTGMSQEQFASAFGFTVSQVRQWEQGRYRPLGAMRAYLLVIGSNPEEVLSMLREALPRKAA